MTGQLPVVPVSCTRVPPGVSPMGEDHPSCMHPMEQAARGNALGSTRSPAGAQGLRHPVRSSWRPCPSWTCPGDFADRRDGGKGCRVRGIPYALLRLPSAHPSNTRSRKSRDGIWESQGSRTLRPHHLCDPVVCCLRNLTISTWASGSGAASGQLPGITP